MEVLSVWHWQTSIGTAWSTFRQARYSFFLPFLFTLYNVEVKEINTVIAPFLEHTNLVPRVHVTLVQWNRQ